MPDEPLISVVEDDTSLRDAMVELVESLGFRAQGHGSAEAFLSQGDLTSDCIITDIQMPGLSGIELKQRLAVRVEIRVRAKDKGQIVIGFESNDDFERVVEALKK